MRKWALLSVLVPLLLIWTSLFSQAFAQTGRYMKRTGPGKAPFTPGHRNPISPISPRYKALVRVIGADPVYWLQNGKLYWVIIPDNINQMSGLSGWGIDLIQNYPASVLNTSSYVTGPRFISTNSASNGLYIRKAGDKDVYKINNGRKEYVSDDSCNQTNCWEDIIEVTQSILDMFVTPDTGKQTINVSSVSLSSEADYTLLHVAKNTFGNDRIPLYATIQDALNAVRFQETAIHVTQETYNGNVVLDAPRTLYLRGGWDPGFESSSSYTTIVGSITIKHGTMILGNIVLTSK